MKDTQLQILKESLESLIDNVIVMSFNVNLAVIPDNEKLSYLFYRVTSELVKSLQLDKKKFEDGLADLHNELKGDISLILTKIKQLNGLRHPKIMVKDNDELKFMPFSEIKNKEKNIDIYKNDAKYGILRLGSFDKIEQTTKDISIYTEIIVNKLAVLCKELDGYCLGKELVVPDKKTVSEIFSAVFEEFFVLIDDALGIPKEGLQGDKPLNYFSSASNKIVDQDIKTKIVPKIIEKIDPKKSENKSNDTTHAGKHKSSDNNSFVNHIFDAFKKKKGGGGMDLSS